MPLIFPWSSVTCPYCFERFHLAKCRRTLADPEEPPVAEPQKPPQPPAKWKFLRILSELRRLAGEAVRWLLKAMATCRNRVYVGLYDEENPLCCPNPKCHRVLPPLVQTGQAKSEFIVVIGARNAGKSNYFGVLLHELQTRLRREIRFTIRPEMTCAASGPVSTQNLYETRYGKNLYGDRPKAVDQTARGTSAPDDLTVPLIYEFEFPVVQTSLRLRLQSLIWQPRASHVSMYFMIYDTAGEDLAALDSNANTRRLYAFLKQATGYFFLIDPLDSPGFRGKLPVELKNQLDAVQTPPETIVNNVHRALKVPRIRVPTAVALTKADMFDHVEGLLYAGSTMCRHSAHLGGFDRDSCDEMHREIEELVKVWGFEALGKAVAEKFTWHRYFAVSALGSQPDRNKALQKPIQSRRIADPLLWLLWVRGYINERPE
jgi:hypothetical protein